jgi:acyl-CoA thioester hydrolase
LLKREALTIMAQVHGRVGDGAHKTGEGMSPLHIHDVDVAPEWIDYNGHMNDACYAIAFSRAGDAFLAHLGLDASARDATGRSIFTLSLTIRFIAEAKLGDRLAINVQLLETDGKRMRYWMEAHRLADRTLVATTEQVLTCVDLTGDRPHSAQFPGEVAEKLVALARAHAELPPPNEAGVGLTLYRRSPFTVTP